jgi:autotransporter-associated beta strand protein
MNYYAVPKILMQGGTLKVNTSMAGFGLNSAVTVASPSNILAGANVLSVFNLDGSISGKSNLTKTGGGAVKLTAAAPNFVGNWIVSEGTLSVNSATGLGTCGATVKPAATLSIESVAGTYSLSVETGGLLVLNKNLTVQAAVLGSVNLPAGNYRAADYPAIISGTGTLIVSGTLLAQTNTDADVTFKASTGSSYSWIKDAAAISTGATYTATDDGSYWVVATNSAGCKITSAPVAVSLVKTVAQSITLKEGWNLISINVRPADSTIATLFNGLDVLEIKDMKTYWRKDQPTFLNLLQTLTPGEGYLVKMNAAGEFNLRGFPDLRGFKNLGGLAPGWSLIGCPYQTAEPIAGLLGSNFLMIKNFDGIWMLNGTANSIENLEPGKGYFVK